MNKTSKLLIVSCLVYSVTFTFLAVYPSQVNAVDCVPYATKQCISNIVYWYNSCGVLQDLYQNCNNTNQICQNGQCVDKISTNPPPSYVKNNTKACYNNDIYWYDSLETVQSLYQSCSDNNQCTINVCNENKCINELQCSGSTCAKDSQDYMTYCANNNQNQTQNQSLTVSVFAKKEGEQLQWSKNISLLKNDKIDFLITIKNNSDFPIDNVLIKTNIPDDIRYTGNLRIDNVSLNEKITLGINLGTISQKQSKVISFTGNTVAQTAKDNLQVYAIASIGNTTYDSDYLIVKVSADNVNNAPDTVGATTEKPKLTDSFINNFTENWYIWTIIAIALIVVFIIIFRKLSSNV